LPLIAVTLCLASCALPDYGDVPFLCGDDGCPAGYQCVSGQCWRNGRSPGDGMSPPDVMTIPDVAGAFADGPRPDSSSPDGSPDARIDASIDAAVDAAAGNGNKYDPCRANADCGADLCCDSELYQCLIRAIARCMP
jgi:hypothetical protein